MARKKVQVAYISCDSARKITYKKRKKGLLKKMEELSTLCGVDTCAVIDAPFEAEPVVWPDTERAQTLVREFRDMPEMDQNRNTFDHSIYLSKRVTKATNRLTYLQLNNREREVALEMHRCLSGQTGLDELSSVDLNDLGWVIERKLKEIGFRRDAMSINTGLQNDVVAEEQPPVQQEEGHNLFGLGLSIDEMQALVGPPIWLGGLGGAGTSGSGSGGGGDGGGAGDSVPPPGFGVSLGN